MDPLGLLSDGLSYGRSSDEMKMTSKAVNSSEDQARLVVPTGFELMSEPSEDDETEEQQHVDIEKPSNE
jgi:hypothetical protein